MKAKNTDFSLVLLIAIILAVYTCFRILFYAINLSYFNDVSLTALLGYCWYGLRFDLSAVFALNMPVVFLLLLPFKFTNKKVYLSIVRILFIVVNATALLFGAVDFVYFKFINTRTSAEIFSYIFMSSDVWVLMPQYIKDFWIILLIFGGLLFGFYKVFGLLFKPLEISFNKTFYLKRAFSLLFWMGLSIICIRGGFQLRPINVASASQYAGSKHIPLVINTPFNIIKTFNKDKLPITPYFPDIETAEHYFAPLQTVHSGNASLNNKNAVIFILESFSKEYIGALNGNPPDNYRGYTPFLDSLIAHSYVFENAYANGKRSIDATLSILAGIPNLMGTAYILSDYAANHINSIASLLKPHGYTSWFFHGGTNGTMGFDNFSRLAGFDNYFGRNEYNNENDFDGKWGIFDEPFLQKMANVLDSESNPFFATVFTLSSHHPYAIPDGYKDVFPKGTLPVHESIGYADHALKLFFETASKTDWFENTVFVFTADHTAEPYYETYKTKTGQYAVPLFFYCPQHSLTGSSKKIAQHTDILPSIMHILHYNEPFVAYGQNLFDSLADGFSVNLSDGIYQFLYSGFFLTFDSSDFLEVYKLEKDSFLSQNVINETDTVFLNQASLLLKAYLQSYQFRMNMNKLSHR